MVYMKRQVMAQIKLCVVWSVDRKRADAGVIKGFGIEVATSSVPSGETSE